MKVILPAVLMMLAATLGTLSAQQTSGSGTANQSCSISNATFKGTLRTLDGDSVNLSTVIGKKPLVLFHIGNDSNSADAADVVESAFEDNSDSDLAFLGTTCDTTRENLDQIGEYDIEFPVVLDPGGTVIGLCNQDVCTPRVLFFDRSGKIVMNASAVTEEVLNDGIAAATTAVAVKDPVCGMDLTTLTASSSYEYKGKTYYFCSQNCHDLFVRNPGKYVKN